MIRRTRALISWWIPLSSASFAIAIAPSWCGHIVEANADRMDFQQPDLEPWPELTPAPERADTNVVGDISAVRESSRRPE